jgi:hypothetical protein
VAQDPIQRLGLGVGHVGPHGPDRPDELLERRLHGGHDGVQRLTGAQLDGRQERRP